MNDLILGLYRPMGDPIAGGMGRVIRVHHTAWKVDLAMKQPHPHLFETDAQKQNFIHECEAWINLGLHPHIVSCHYVRDVDGIPSIFAEWMDGGSLANWIKSGKLYEGGDSSALRRILDIAIQFAWGLDYAHEKGLIHQDVKPENVLLSTDGDAKVADFGIAKAKRDLSLSSCAAPRFEGTLISNSGAYTPAYCAPEQAGGGTLSRRTDIWSWAVSVMEMFVGERLWSSGSVAGTACDTYFEAARVPVPESIKDLLRECFIRIDGERPRNFKIVADRLQLIFTTVVGEEYPHKFPEAAEIRGDALNNRAVSMLDLGLTAEAECLFNQVLASDPAHPQATYNQGLYLWRSARMTDIAIVTALEESQNTRRWDWNAPYLLGLIQTERQKADDALTALSAAKRLNGGDELQKALTEAKHIQSWAPKCLRTFLGHAAYVLSVVLSADGRWALSGGWDKTLRLWDVSTGECLRVFVGHDSSVCSVALSADGRWALSGGGDITLSGGGDKTLRLWDVISGECLRTFVGHENSVSSVALSSDGQFAFSGSWDKTLRLWDVSTGECLRVFVGHDSSVCSVALSADGRCALSGSGDKTLRLWDVGSGECLRIYEGHDSSVCSVALSADGRWALSGSGDKTLRLWDVSTGECLRTFVGHDSFVRSVALSADGRWALSGSSDETLRLWDVSSGKCLRTFEEHKGFVDSMALSANGRLALWGSRNNLRLWDISGLIDCHQILSAPFVVCRSAGTKESLVVQKRFYATLNAARNAFSEGKFSRAWNLASEARNLVRYEFSREALDIAHQAGLRGTRTRLRAGWCMQRMSGHREPVRSVALSADGRWALSGSRDKTLRLWDVSSGECLRIFVGHVDCVSSVALSADGRWALSGSLDNTLRLWDVGTGECLRTFVGHENCVHSIALSADGRWALSGGGDIRISGGGDKTLRLWDVSSGECVRTFVGHADCVSSVALSADGRWALSGSWEEALRLWEVSSGKCLRTFVGHDSSVTSVALSADGRWALWGSFKTLRLWDVSTGECLRTFVGHDSSVTSVALSADGRWALSGGRDKTLRLWDVGSGECLRTFGHEGSVSPVALSADGRWALSANGDKTLRQWSLDWDYEFPDLSDWDEGARPYLANFLCRHTPYASELPTETLPTDEQIKLALTRWGKPIWTDQDFTQLITQLQYAGFGWVRPEGVRRELEKMTANWPLG